MSDKKDSKFVKKMVSRSQRKPKQRDVHGKRNYKNYTPNKYGDPIRGPKIAKNSDDDSFIYPFIPKPGGPSFVRTAHKIFFFFFFVCFLDSKIRNF